MNATQQQAQRRRETVQQQARERQVQQELNAHLRRLQRDAEQRRIHAEYVREMRGLAVNE